MGYVNLLDVDPKEAAVIGALGCNDQRSTKDILGDLRNGQINANAVLKNSLHRGHGSVGDQAEFIFSLENVPRLMTLFLCSTQYGEHLQQSQRRVTADPDFELSRGIARFENWDGLYDQAVGLCKGAFVLYQQMAEYGIPIEDARYILPLAMTTNIQTKCNLRQLFHYRSLLGQKFVPETIRIIILRMCELVDNRYPGLMADYELDPIQFFPAATLFTDNYEMEMVPPPPGMITGKIAEGIRERNLFSLAMLKAIHYEFKINLSVASFHQAVRQRTWDHVAAPLIRSLAFMNIVIPPSIMNSKFCDQFDQQAKLMIKFIIKVIDSGLAPGEAFCLIPQCLMMTDFIHLNGWNIIHSLAKRTCNKAQWEIREIAFQMAAEIRRHDRRLGEFIEPQCKLFGKCPERNPCGVDDGQL